MSVINNCSREQTQKKKPHTSIPVFSAAHKTRCMEITTVEFFLEHYKKAKTKR
jgi:hypothetical protein